MFSGGFWFHYVGELAQKWDTKIICNWGAHLSGEPTVSRALDFGTGHPITEPVLFLLTLCVDRRKKDKNTRNIKKLLRWNHFRKRTVVITGVGGWWILFINWMERPVYPSRGLCSIISSTGINAYINIYIYNTYMIICRYIVIGIFIYILYTCFFPKAIGSPTKRPRITHKINQ